MKTVVRWLILSLILAGLYWLASNWSSFISNLFPPQNSYPIVVMPLQGDLEIDQGAGWQKFDQNNNFYMIFPDGTKFRTSSRGKASLVFADDSLLLLDPDTTFTLTGQSITNNSRNISLTVEVGRVWAQVIKFFNPESSFMIETQTVVATVRGTDFGITVDSDKSINCWVDNGQVMVEVKDSNQLPFKFELTDRQMIDWSGPKAMTIIDPNWLAWMADKKREVELIRQRLKSSTNHSPAQSINEATDQKIPIPTPTQPAGVRRPGKSTAPSPMNSPTATLNPNPSPVNLVSPNPSILPVTVTPSPSPLSSPIQLLRISPLYLQLSLPSPSPSPIILY